VNPNFRVVTLLSVAAVLGILECPVDPVSESIQCENLPKGAD